MRDLEKRVRDLERKTRKAETLREALALANPKNWSCWQCLYRQGDGDQATALGLRLTFTPVHSPERNGMSEALVKTLKRDHARNVILTDNKTGWRLLPS